MTIVPKISLDAMDAHYAASESRVSYHGPLRRHVDEDGDLRLERLLYDDSPAAFRLWNFLLTEEDRLHAARASGKKIVGTMKDLGTVPVLAYAFPELVAFYPDGAWWIPCVMELNTGLLAIADSLGVGESFCPVRAMLGAFLTEAHFPIPDLLTCSVGATCDDFSAIAQRLNGLGYPILWWEMPHRRTPEPGEPAVELPGGCIAPAAQVAFVRGELERLRAAFEELAGHTLTDEALCDGVRQANRVRAALRELRQLAYSTSSAPIPALEMLIAEMLAIHFCSDRTESLAVLEDMLALACTRVENKEGVAPSDAARVFWVNPVADLRMMNLFEDCGARLAGTDFMFSHALDPLPEDIPPMEALTRAALADPMAGSAEDRAVRVCADCVRFRAEGVVVSRIPGASHCAFEGEAIAQQVRERLGLPVVELEAPPVSDAMGPSLRTRLQALVEAIYMRRENKGVQHDYCGN